MSAVAAGAGPAEALVRLGRGRVVPLGEADRELREAWTAIDEDSRHTDGESMLRLREVNLVAVTGERHVEKTRVVAALTAREHPGRVIVVAPGGTGSTATISTGCLLDRFSGRRVCSEEVVIQGVHGDDEQLQAAVLQLLVPDVPVVGWWSGETDSSAAGLVWLAYIADQLVTDLSQSSDVPAATETLLSLLRSRPGLHLRDMEWLRIGPWRELVAEFFERPDRRGLIPRIEALEVRHRAAPTAALLLGAWFASRLALEVSAERWAVADGSASLSFARPKAGAARFRLTLRTDREGIESARADGLVGLKIHLERDPGVDAGGGECSGRVVTIDRLPHSLVCGCDGGDPGGGAVVKSVGLSPGGDERLLSGVIDTPVREEVFEESLRLTSDLLAVPGLSGTAAEGLLSPRTVTAAP